MTSVWSDQNMYVTTATTFGLAKTMTLRLHLLSKHIKVNKCNTVIIS